MLIELPPLHIRFEVEWPRAHVDHVCPDGCQVPLMMGDPQKCTQLVYNLVTNACKFTERGTVTIEANYDKEKQLLEVSVVDTGKGISKEGQKRIFSAFEQEQNGDNRSFQGIGLGLAVCTEIVELHEGTLRVSSELGKGSRPVSCLSSVHGEHFAARQAVLRLCLNMFFVIFALHAVRSRTWTPPCPSLAKCVAL